MKLHQEEVKGLVIKVMADNIAQIRRLSKRSQSQCIVVLGLTLRAGSPKMLDRKAFTFLVDKGTIYPYGDRLRIPCRPEWASPNTGGWSVESYLTHLTWLYEVQPLNLSSITRELAHKVYRGGPKLYCQPLEWRLEYFKKYRVLSAGRY